MKVHIHRFGTYDTFLWLLSTDGVTKAFSHRSHLYFLCPSCTTWMCTFSVSLRLNVASHWSHLNVLSPGQKEQMKHETSVGKEQFPLLPAQRVQGCFCPARESFLHHCHFCVPTALWEPLCCPKCLSSFGNCSIILPELFFTLKDTGVCTHVHGKGRGGRNEKEKWGGQQIRLK